MIKDNQHDNAPEAIEELEQALTTTENFLETNQKTLTIGFIAILVIVAMIFGFIHLYQNPREKAAAEEMFVSVANFEKDSFQLALNGDAEYLGLIDIIEEYSGTPQANRAYYYAGVALLNSGEFESAKEYLSNFSSDDIILAPIAEGAIGDAECELGNREAAISQYLKAAKVSDNNMTAPIYLMKAANLYELDGNKEKALEIYSQIKENYKKSIEARNIDKYIGRVSN